MDLFEKHSTSQNSALYKEMQRSQGDSVGVRSGQARAHCEDLWADFRKYADQNFVTEFAANTHARWFEMYLTVSLARAGHEIDCPKPGPDILLKTGGRRIWIEATSATPGEIGRADSVPSQEMGQVNREPTDQYVLRIRNALDKKQEKYIEYVNKGLVHKDDVKVVAINVYEVGGLSPYIGDHFRRSLYGVGEPVVQVDLHSRRIASVGNATVVAVQKAAGAEVGVQPFVDSSMGHVAAVLGSEANPFNPPSLLGSEVVLYPNLTSNIPWPQRTLKVGAELCFDQIQGGWRGTLVGP